METEFSLSKFLSETERSEDPIPEPSWGEETEPPVTWKGNDSRH